MYHEGPALTSADSVQEPVQHVALGTAVGQLRRAIPLQKSCALVHGTNAIPRPRQQTGVTASHWRIDDGRPVPAPA
jgi:hypothetical protein